MLIKGGRDTASKPRWIGLGVLIMALGSLVFAIPQFTVPAYRGMHEENSICHQNTSSKVIGTSFHSAIIE